VVEETAAVVEDTAPVEPPVVETAVVETPVVETPVVEAAVVEAAVVEAPVVEAAVVEAAVVEAAVVEAAVVEAPVVEDEGQVQVCPTSQAGGTVLLQFVHFESVQDRMVNMPPGQEKVV